MTEKTNRERAREALLGSGLNCLRVEEAWEVLRVVTALLDERDREHESELRWLEETTQGERELALAARVVELEEMLETCRDAIHSLPQDSLGVGKETVRSDDGQAGLMTWPIRDELVSNITTALSSPSPAVEAVREVVKVLLRRRHYKRDSTPADRDVDRALDDLIDHFPALVAGLEEG